MQADLPPASAPFDADHRTAQRMARALEDTFPAVEIRTDDDRRRRWALQQPPARAGGLSGEFSFQPWICRRFMMRGIREARAESRAGWSERRQPPGAIISAWPVTVASVRAALRGSG
jgi:hypothetical protein